jgi:hypothetical protein
MKRILLDPPIVVAEPQFGQMTPNPFGQMTPPPPMPSPASEPAPPVPPRTISSLTTRLVMDSPLEGKVAVFFAETIFPVTIWSGDAYDAAGQWTDESLASAVNAMVEQDASAFVTLAMTRPSPRTPNERRELVSRIALNRGK